MKRLWAIAVVLSVFDAVLLVPGLSLPGIGQASIPRLLILVAVMASLGHAAMTPSATLARTAVARTAAPMCLWFGWTILSVVWSSHGPEALRYVSLTVGNFVVFWKAADLAQDQDWANGIFQWPFVIAFVLGTIELFGGPRLEANRQFAMEHLVVGPFVNPLFFAFALALYFPATLWSIGASAGIRRVAMIVVAGLSIWLMVRTGSRTGLIALATCGIAFWLVGLTSRGRTVAALVACVAALLMAFAGPVVVTAAWDSLPEPVAEKLSTLPSIFSTSSNLFLESSRGHAAGVLLTASEDAVLVGRGAGAVEGLLGANEIAAEEGNVNAHNWWLELLVNGGVVSIALFLVAFVRLVVQMLSRVDRAASVRYERQVLVAAPLALLLGLLVFPIVSFGPGSLVNSTMPWLFFGISVGVIAGTPRKRRILTPPAAHGRGQSGYVDVGSRELGNAR